jgi:hypothetical protein
MGYPVVLKGEHPAIAHKTEAGIVRIGIRDEVELRSACMTIEDLMRKAAPGQRANGVLVAEMVPQGIELMMGSRRDPVFGPVLMFGLGGVFVEALKDVGMCPAPLDEAQSRALIGRMRSASLLRGARGQRPVDIDRLASLLRALSTFALANARYVSDIDINPLVSTHLPSDNLRVLDALIVLDPATTKDLV